MKIYESNASPIVVAKTRLLQKFPWYGILIQRLEVKEQSKEFFDRAGFGDSIIGTDGKCIYYNKLEFDKLNRQQQLFLTAQQVLRCILFHFSRIGMREPKRWNLAGSIVANGMLINDGVGEMPQSETWSQEFDNLSTEQVYLKLKEMPQSKQDKMSQGCNGCVMPQQNGKDKSGEGDTGSGESEWQVSPEQSEMDWKVAMEQAALQMRKRGLISGSMDRVLEDSRISKTDWRERIRQYLTVKGDVAWSKPNRRYISRGLYLPSVKKSRLGHLVFCIDTSGSINDEMLQLFAGEINEILSVADEWPERVSVMWADSDVKGVEDQEGELVLRPKGGGGTAFQPSFNYISENDWTPQVMFYLTDMCGDRPRQPSEYPVVWVVPKEYEEQYKSVGWGDLVVVEN